VEDNAAPLVIRSKRRPRKHPCGKRRRNRDVIQLTRVEGKHLRLVFVDYADVYDADERELASFQTLRNRRIAGS